MATYKYGIYLQQNSDAAFDTIFQPGELVERPGIYRCTNCGREVVVKRHGQLPPGEHHRHPRVGQVRWRLVILADGTPKHETAW